MTRVPYFLPAALLALLALPALSQQLGYKTDSTKPTVINQGQIVEWRLSEQAPEGGPAVDGSYFLKQAGFSAAWHFNDAIRRRGPGAMVSVGVLDVGFGEHDELRSKYKGDLSMVHPPDQLRPDKLNAAAYGTFVAGVIAAADDNKGIKGCTPFATIHPVSIDVGRISSDSPQERVTSFNDVLRNLDNLVREARVKVINVGVVANYRFREPNEGERQATVSHARILAPLVDRAAEKGILLVSPAGNDSFDDRRRVNACWGSPLNYLGLKGGDQRGPRPNVIVVESVGKDGKRSPFSNVGGHLAAPGENLMGLALFDEEFRPKSGVYTVRSGTGLAAAQVAALVAHLFAYNPDLKIAQVLPILNVRKPNLGDEATPPPTINAFDAMLKCQQSSWRDLADLDGSGRVDRKDFNRFKKALTAAEHLRAKRPLYPREDLNGDGQHSRDGRVRIWDPKDQAGYRPVTDLEVMMAVWDDPEFAQAKDLPRQLDGRP